MTPAKLTASQEFALSKGIEPLKHHLLPRPKGFAVTINALKDSSKCARFRAFYSNTFTTLLTIMTDFLHPRLFNHFD